MAIDQLLVYPITDYDFSTLSYREEANAVPLGMPTMRYFCCS